MQIPAAHVQPGKVGADLNAGEILQCARVASDAALLRRAKGYVSRCRGRVGTEMAADAAGPHAAAFLVGLRIGRTSDQRTRLGQKCGVHGIDRRHQRAHRRRHVRYGHARCLSDHGSRCVQTIQSGPRTLSLGGRSGQQQNQKCAGS